MPLSEQTYPSPIDASLSCVLKKLVGHPAKTTSDANCLARTLLQVELQTLEPFYFFLHGCSHFPDVIKNGEKLPRHRGHVPCLDSLDKACRASIQIPNATATAMIQQGLQGTLTCSVRCLAEM